MTVSMLPLRDYQSAAVRAIFAAIGRGIRRPAVVMPTGTGKTVTYAHFIVDWLKAHPGTRVLMLAHRDELLSQGQEKLADVAPDLLTGIVAARRNETLADVVFGSVATLRVENRRRQLRNVSLVIVDEAHHATAKSYVDVLRHFGCLSESEPGAAGGAVAVGFTATMMRGDSAHLGEIWQDVVFTYQIHEAIERGYLCRPRGLRVRVDDLDLGKVRKVAGDISERGAGAAIEDSLAPEAVAKAVAEHASDRPGVLFAPTVKTAELFAQALNEAGFPAAVAHGQMSKDERRAFMADVRAGKIQISCNCTVYTEGTDVPEWSVAILARPTLHQGLYLQMAGRILRPFAGKTDALILDVVGATQRHALLGAIDLFGEELIVDREEKESKERLHHVSCEGDSCSGLPCECWRHGSALTDDDEPGWVNGPIAVEEVDLFHGSSSLWLTTYAGIRFLPVDERLIIIMPGQLPGTWDVCSIHAKRINFGSRYIRQGVHDLAYAMAYAEGDMTPTEKRAANKERSWRMNRPYPMQMRMASQMGIPTTPFMSKGEVSNLLAVRFASARIDPYLPDYARAAL